MQFRAHRKSLAFFYYLGKCSCLGGIVSVQQTFVVNLRQGCGCERGGYGGLGTDMDPAFREFLSGVGGGGEQAEKFFQFCVISKCYL